MSSIKSPTRELFMDRYELLRELGEGGMGVVCLAYDVELRREVALKRIKGGPNARSLQERFRREYQALAAVDHTGVPAIFHCERPGSREAYFTMEIVKGETLREHMDRGPLAPARALALAIDLGRVLMAVHAAGVVHRDVKPSNVIVEPGGRVRLIDFGACYLSRVYYGQPHLRAVTEEGERWETGDLEFVGTAAYTDPQYFTEGLTSPQSDVFSVCVVLYEMLTGRHLFDHDRMRHRTIQPEEFAPELAPLVAELRRGVSIAFERHTSMEELVRRLEILKATLDRPAGSTIPRPGSARRWVVAGVAAVSFVLGGVAVHLAGTRPDADVLVTAAAATGVEHVRTPAVEDDMSSETPMDGPTDEREPPVEEVAPPLGPEPPPTSSPTLSSRPRRPAVLTWEARARKAEALARRCLEAEGVAPRSLLVTLSPNTPAEVRGVPSDSAHARCIRDALDRVDLRFDKPRRHTFFVTP